LLEPKELPKELKLMLLPLNELLIVLLLKELLPKLILLLKVLLPNVILLLKELFPNVLLLLLKVFLLLLNELSPLNNKFVLLKLLLLLL